MDHRFLPLADYEVFTESQTGIARQSTARELNGWPPARRLTMVHSNIDVVGCGRRKSASIGQWDRTSVARRTCLRSCGQLGGPRLQHAEWRDG
jgi:hypothetical protein